MKTLTEAEFLRWAEQAGMGLDERYPDSAVLSFRPYTGLARFWGVPPEPEARPYFVAAFLDLMGDWRSCYVWKHLGSWRRKADEGRLNDAVELRIQKGLGLPMGTSDVVQFSRAEEVELVTLIFATTIFGWSVGDDLYVVPDHARYIVQTDHHDVIHVCFRSEAELEDWVRGMEMREYFLPDDIPDATFKRPSWLKRADEQN